MCHDILLCHTIVPRDKQHLTTNNIHMAFKTCRSDEWEKKIQEILKMNLKISNIKIIYTIIFYFRNKLIVIIAQLVKMYVNFFIQVPGVIKFKIQCTKYVISITTDNSS